VDCFVLLGCFPDGTVGSEDQRADIPGPLSCESEDDNIPLAKAAQQIRKNVFYPLERMTNHSIAALGAIMPRTGTEPRHAHYCLRLFNFPADPQGMYQALSSINKNLPNFVIRFAPPALQSY